MHTVVQRHPVGVVAAHRHHNAVDKVGNGQRVGHDVHRRQVDDDEVIHLAQLAQQPLHLARAQQLRGVGGHVAGGQNAEIGHKPGGVHRLVGAAQARQQVGKAGLHVHAQLFGHAGQTHIRVDQQHFPARLGYGVGQVDGGGGLALAPDGAGDAHQAALVLIRQGKKQVGAELLIGLRRRKAQLVAQHAALLLGGDAFGAAPPGAREIQTLKHHFWPPSLFLPVS